jgi:hypothetical protein
VASGLRVAGKSWAAFIDAMDNLAFWTGFDGFPMALYSTVSIAKGGKGLLKLKRFL